MGQNIGKLIQDATLSDKYSKNGAKFFETISRVPHVKNTLILELETWKNVVDRHHLEL